MVDPTSPDFDSWLDGIPAELRQEMRRQSRQELARRGDLSWAMHPGQADIWRHIEAHPEASQWALEIARKWGKTFFLALVAATLCQRHPKARVPYGAPTLKHLSEFILPVLSDVEALFPKGSRPRYRDSTGHWEFPDTGSWVHLFGADDEPTADRGRGPKAIACIFDEAGFTPVLSYVIREVFRPSMLYAREPGVPRFTLIGSTPAREADHDFTRLCEIAEANGHHFNRTVYDNPMLSPSEIETFIEENARDSGMTAEEYKQSAEFQREYLARRITDKRLLVMGDDWERARPKALTDKPRPQFFDAYQGLDMGGTDPRAVLFAYWDFKRRVLVFEDEILLRDQENTAQLAEAIKEKERELYGVTGWNGTLRAIREEKMSASVLMFLPPEDRARVLADAKAPLQPFLRVCDHNIQQAIDLSVLHGITFLPTEKTEKRLHVNDFRVGLRLGQIEVKPNCKHLDRQLRTTLWKNERATDYQRRSGEHGDLIDCAVYIWRNVRKERNPVPANWGRDLEREWLPPLATHTPEDEALLRFAGGDS